VTQAVRKHPFGDACEPGAALLFGGIAPRPAAVRRIPDPVVKA